MTNLIYGTTNTAKLHFMREVLSPLDLNIISINKALEKMPAGASRPIDESGNNPLENAKIKALSYWNVLKKPIFSCDSGLYIDGLPDHLQPGVHVRRVNGTELTDEQMIQYYANLANSLGGKAVAQYHNAICLIISETEIHEHIGPDIASQHFYLVPTPHPNLQPGFPLDSLSVDIQSGKYFKDLPFRPRHNTYTGFRNFFKNVLNL